MGKSAWSCSCEVAFTTQPKIPQTSPDTGSSLGRMLASVRLYPLYLNYPMTCATVITVLDPLLKILIKVQRKIQVNAVLCGVVDVRVCGRQSRSHSQSQARPSQGQAST